MAKMSEKLLQAKMAGTEPTVVTITRSNDPMFIEALSWYNRNFEEKNYLKTAKNHNMPTDAKSILWNRTVYAILHMVDRGWELPADVITRNAARIRQIKLKARNNETVERTARRSPFDIQLDNAMMFMDDEIDAFIRDVNYKHTMYNFLLSNKILPQVATRLKDKLAAIIADYANEGFDNVGKVDLKKRVDFYKTMIKDIDSHIVGRKTTSVRKPRKKKAVSAEKQSEKVKYQEHDAELKITSVSPDRIVGAQQVWMYNTKYKRLIVLNAQDADGLKVKGTTVYNFNEDTSSAKSIRKPKDIIPSLYSVGKIALRKFMDEINAKPYPANGRINEQTIIVRVTK